jgi:hypothetical protein
MKKQFNNFIEIERMLQFLDIQEVTTDRQEKNGTREFELPIKDAWTKRKIRVASFKTGYVRNQNSASSNYQLNKQVDGKPEYYKLSNGDYRKYTGKVRVLIPDEQDRLEYLISYCLKNYYIGHANQVADGDYVPKWKYENDIKNAVVENTTPEVSVNINGQRYEII